MDSCLLFLYGLYSLMAQVFLLRELGIVFLGHELSFNLALASWLLWSGLGAFPGGEPPRAAPRDLAGPLGRLALAAPLTMLAVRLAKLLTPFGQLPGLAEAVLVPLIFLGPVCWANGAVFRRALGIFSPARAYVLECAGALCGGLAASFLLAGHAPGLTVVAAGAAALSAMGWLASRGARGGLCAVACLILAAASGPLDESTRRLEWRGYTLVAQREGRYEHLAIASLGSLQVLFENGVVSTRFPDPAASEELVHWPLLAHPSPSRVLMLGAAAAPLLAEVLKHPVGSVDVVVSDRAALDLVVSFLNETPAGAWKDGRVRVAESDPREWVAGHAASYDVILQLSADPANAALNRLFTSEFFAQARRALSTGGIFAFSIPSSENYLSPETAYADASIWNALSPAFAHRQAIPGGRMIVLAGGQPVELDAGRLAQAYASRKISNRVLVPGEFRFYLASERRQALLSRLAEFGGARANADILPAAYFRAWNVWLSKFMSPAQFLGLLALAGAGFWGLARFRSARRELLSSPETTTIMSLGFSGMVLEIVLLLAFQAASGALYWQLGLLMAAFMTGLSLAGALAAWRVVSGGGRAGLIALAAALAAASLTVAYFLPELCSVGASRAIVVFGSLLALDGFILGTAYPLACGKDPAAVYSADLWGSAAGAFLTAAFIVPLAGMKAALIVGAAALLPAAVRLALS